MVPVRGDELSGSGREARRRGRCGTQICRREDSAELGRSELIAASVHPPASEQDRLWWLTGK